MYRYNFPLACFLKLVRLILNTVNIAPNGFFAKYPSSIMRPGGHPKHPGKARKPLTKNSRLAPSS